jgi:DNA-binding Xre family transcriptional regulator
LKEGGLKIQVRKGELRRSIGRDKIQQRKISKGKGKEVRMRIR